MTKEQELLKRREEFWGFLKKHRKTNRRMAGLEKTVSAHKTNRDRGGQRDGTRRYSHSSEYVD